MTSRGEPALCAVVIKQRAPLGAGKQEGRGTGSQVPASSRPSSDSVGLVGSRTTGHGGQALCEGAPSLKGDSRLALEDRFIDPEIANCG